MTRKEIKNYSVSVKNRLFDLSRNTGRDFQELAVRYTVECFLTRLSKSDIRGNLGKMPIRLQVDVGFGDQVTPPPQKTEFPALLSVQGPIIRSYSPETVIAEKFNAMVIFVRKTGLQKKAGIPSG